SIKYAHYPLVTGGETLGEIRRNTQAKTPSKNPLRVRSLWENGNLFLNIAYNLFCDLQLWHEMRKKTTECLYLPPSLGLR
ncbi:MAG: hypothetical protein OXI61_20260, partial [Candidatus Poribacteria bacterium]|nr:hypothetical protein [Candidatus Poribacteria bacterium]